MNVLRKLGVQADAKARRKSMFRVSDFNGEIIEGALVLTPEMLEAIRRKKEIEMYQNRTAEEDHFTMVNMEGAKELLLLEALNTKELGYFLLLQTYLDYKNMLKKTEDAKLPLTIKELVEILRIRDNRTSSKLIEKFIELGLLEVRKTVLFKKEYDAFYINAKYCFRGLSKETKLVRVFIKSLQKLYTEADIKPADIGFLYRILPYIHYKSNHLVRHPYEKDYAIAEALSLRDIVEITGMAESNVKEHLRIKLSGQHVFGSFKAGKNSVYKVNPSLFYRGKAPELVKADFTLTEDSHE